ncbi:MAG TPA: bifunctional 3-hydroxydecanoyl-ACP dehydratase/trans-2-decenoyl-ACP isomerase [Candidatus Paceibacterota bacterium]
MREIVVPKGDRGSFVKKSSYNARELRESADGKWGEAPPLPADYMHLVERVTEIRETGGPKGLGYVRSELDLNAGLWFFLCHFKGDPVMPGLLGIDALMQTLGFYIGWRGALGRGRAMGLGGVQFLHEVPPTAKRINYEVDITRFVPTRKGWFAEGDGRVLLDNNVIYVALDMKTCVLPPEVRTV